jgi:hypothetical protein
MLRCLLVLLLYAAVLPAREIHAATTGSDSNDGSAVRPLRTISAPRSWRSPRQCQVALEVSF